MRRKRPLKKQLAIGVFLTLLVALLWTMPSSARTTCRTYSNSSVIMQGNSVFCAGSGGNCTECVIIGGGGGGGPSVLSCWSTGFIIICEDGSGGYYLV